MGRESGKTGQIVLQTTLPDDMRAAAAAPLPRMRPLEGSWLRVDEAYAGQMALRRDLIRDRPGDVQGQMPGSEAACGEVLGQVLADLPAGFRLYGPSVICPDGVEISVDRNDPLRSIGRLIQQDICVLIKDGPEHVLSAAVLCFPASWTLAEKLGRPLMGVHDPVADYDAGIGRRVQRLFDGLRPGRPLWRANLLRYEEPDLFQPRAESDPRSTGGAGARYMRSEHQTLMKLPRTGAVVFAIHTVLVESEFG